MSERWPDQPEMMVTRKGIRMIARRGPDGVCLLISGIEWNLAPAESRMLRTLLEAAEQAHARTAGNDDH